jgi:hypothetical protein
MITNHILSKTHKEKRTREQDLTNGLESISVSSSAISIFTSTLASQARGLAGHDGTARKNPTTKRTWTTTKQNKFNLGNKTFRITSEVLNSKLQRSLSRRTSINMHVFLSHSYKRLFELLSTISRLS